MLRARWALAAIGLMLAGLLAATSGLHSFGGAASKPLHVDRSAAAASESPALPGGEPGEEASGPPARCWRGLEVFEAPDLSLTRFRALAGGLLSSDDPLVSSYLEERLAELIGSDPQRALEVLGWIKGGAGDAEVQLALAGLKGSQAIFQPAVARQILALGLDSALEPDRRAQLIAALDTQKSLPGSAMDKLASLAMDAGAGPAGWMATRTLGRVMQEDAAHAGSVSPYMDRLLDIGAGAADASVRTAALEMPLIAEIILDERSAARHRRILMTDPDPGVRELAAHNLSLSRDRKDILSVYARAFERETDLCVRWALFRFAARAAGAAALPVMAAMAASDPRFRDVEREFEAIYAQGVVDFERVWLALPSDDPFQCLHRDGDPA